jgi:hypothetical protein
LSSGSDSSAIQISTYDPKLSNTPHETLPWLTRSFHFFLRNFWKTNYFLSLSIKRSFRIFILFLNLLEISLIISYLIHGVGVHHRVPSQLERFSAWLSVVYIFWFDYQSATYLHIILSSMKRFLILLSLFGVFVVSCVCLGTYNYHLNLYGNEETETETDDVAASEKQNYFDTFHDSLWTVLTSISTTSFPDQLVPYYTDSRLTFLFFFFYLSIGNFLFLNLVLIFVMAEYNTSLQQTQQKKSYQRKENLKMAFEVLDVYQRGYLSYSQVYDLLQEVYGSYPEFRGGYLHYKIPSPNEMAVLVAALDINGDNFIYEEQFMWILHLTQIVIQEKVLISLCFPLTSLCV